MPRGCGPPCIRTSNIRTSNANCWCRTHKTGLNAQGEQNYILTVRCVKWLPSVGAEFPAQVSRVRLRGQLTEYLNFTALLPRLSMGTRSHITITFLPLHDKTSVAGIGQLAYNGSSVHYQLLPCYYIWSQPTLQHIQEFICAGPHGDP